MWYCSVFVFRTKAEKPKRSLDKVDYQELADIKLSKRSWVASSSKAALFGDPEHTLYRLKILQCNEDQVKVVTA